MRVMFQQVGRFGMIKKQHKTTTVSGTNDVCWERKEVFVEKHVFRDYLVFIEDVSNDSMSMTEDVICKIN